MANQRCLGWNPRTHRFLSSACSIMLITSLKESFIVWSHSLAKTELCKIVMNELQFLINLKGALLKGALCTLQYVITYSEFK